MFFQSGFRRFFLAFTLAFIILFWVVLLACQHGGKNNSSSTADIDYDTSADDTQIDDDDEYYQFPDDIVLYGTLSLEEVNYNLSEIQKFSWRSWEEEIRFENCQLLSIWGINENNIYAVGRQEIANWDLSHDFVTSWTIKPYIAHYNYGNWETEITDEYFYSYTGINGKSETNIYLVGGQYLGGFGGYVIKHYNGVKWNTEATGGEGKYLNDVWVTPSGIVAAVGAIDIPMGSLFVVKENGVWNEKEKIGDNFFLYTVWGDENNDIYAGGEEIYKYENGEWKAIESPVHNNQNYVIKIAGTDSNNIYAVAVNSGDNEVFIIHYNGVEWNVIELFEGAIYGPEWGTHLYIPNLANNSIGLWVSENNDVFFSFPLYHHRTYVYHEEKWYLLSYDIGANAIWGIKNQ